MNWENQMGVCPNCKNLIAARDFINNTHQCKAKETN